MRQPKKNETVNLRYKLQKTKNDEAMQFES